MDLFFSICLSFLDVSQCIVHFFFKHLCNKKMICIHIFFKRKYSIGFVIRKQSFPCLSFWIYSNYQILIIKYTVHLCVYQINFCIVIYLHNKNSNIKRLCHVVSRFSFEHAIFPNFPSLFFHCHFLDSYLFYLDTWIFLKTIFCNYIIHTYFNCFIIPTYHIFICRRFFHW